MLRRLMLLAALAAPPLAGQQAGTAPPVWALSGVPTLDIGDDRNTQTQFDGVTGIVRMPRGEIVVANGMSQELRVFSPTGAHLRTIARAGIATGELRALNRIWRSGDTILVAELTPSENNVHLFSTTAFLGKHVIGASNAGGISPLDRFPDGRYVITAPRRSSQAPQVARPFIDSTPLGILSLADRGRPQWIGSLASQRMLVQELSNSRGRRVTLVQVPLGRSTAYAVSGDRLWVGDSETGVVAQFNSTGRKVAEFVAPIPPRPVDSTTLRLQRERLLSDAMNWNDRARVDVFYTIPLPATAPRFTRFLPGTNGEMWLGLYQESLDAPGAYLVVDRAGRPLGRVVMPRGVTPYEVGPSSILAVRRDADGLEHVVEYSLIR